MSKLEDYASKYQTIRMERRNGIDSGRMKAR